MSREQIDTLKWLHLKAESFGRIAEEVWWHAANSYGAKERIERLSNLRAQAEELIKFIDRAIEEQQL